MIVVISIITIIWVGCMSLLFHRLGAIEEEVKSMHRDIQRMHHKIMKLSAEDTGQDWK